MKSSKEIRQALIQIADKNNRPHYTQMVVRDVIHAVQNNLDHPLKAAVLAEKIQVVSQGPKSKVEIIKEFCAIRGMISHLAEHSGFSVSYLNQIISDERGLNDDLYKIISGAFTRAETDFARKGIKSKSKTHGTSNCYKNGCRCADCSAATQEENQVRLRQIANKYCGATA